MTADECRMLGLDPSARATQEKVLGTIALGDGNVNGITRIFKEEGLTNEWHQFQQLKLPPKSQLVTTTATNKRKKKEDPFLDFDASTELEVADVLKNCHKPTASARKKAFQGVTNEEFSQLLIEKNYHFPLNRYTAYFLI